MTGKRRRRGPRLRVALAGGGLVAVAALLGLAPSLRPLTVLAACHHFTVRASPSTVTAGGTVTATVSRDAALAPSHVDVSSVDETAKAGEDYQAVTRTIQFQSDTSQSFPVQTLRDNEATPSETFRLHLSNPGGCAVNPNFVLDPDVRVTIRAASTTTASASSTPASSTTSTASTASMTSSSAAPIAAPATGAGGELPLGIGIGAVAVGITLAGSVALLRRRR